MQQNIKSIVLSIITFLIVKCFRLWYISTLFLTSFSVFVLFCFSCTIAQWEKVYNVQKSEKLSMHRQKKLVTHRSSTLHLFWPRFFPGLTCALTCVRFRLHLSKTDQINLKEMQLILNSNSSRILQLHYLFNSK